MRRLTSIILAIAFVVLSVSGVQMTLPKPQSVQQQTVGNPEDNKVMVKREKSFYPKAAHEWAGYLFIGAGLVHVVLNRKPMVAYLKPGKK